MGLGGSSSLGNIDEMWHEQGQHHALVQAKAQELLALLQPHEGNSEGQATLYHVTWTALQPLLALGGPGSLRAGPHTI